MSFDPATAELALRALSYSGSGNWLDESGNGHQAVPVGSPIWNGDRFTFNGTVGQYFSLGDVLDQGVDNSFTVVAVASTNLISLGQAVLVLKRSDIVSGPGWSMHRNASDLQTHIGDESLTSSTSVPDMQVSTRFWCALRRDAVNDELTASTEFANPSTVADSTGSLANDFSMTIGANRLGNRPWNGDIYGVVLIQAALTIPEIEEVGDWILGIAPQVSAGLDVEVDLGGSLVMPTASVRQIASSLGLEMGLDGVLRHVPRTQHSSGRSTAAVKQGKIFTLRQNDTAPPIRATLGVDNEPVDIQGATVKFHMINLSGLVVLDQPATSDQVGDGSDGTLGWVSYAWQTGDTSIPGRYRGEWEVTFPDGTIRSFPVDYQMIDISPEIA